MRLWSKVPSDGMKVLTILAVHQLHSLYSKECVPRIRGTSWSTRFAKRGESRNGLGSHSLSTRRISPSGYRACVPRCWPRMDSEAVGRFESFGRGDLPWQGACCALAQRDE